MPYFVPVFLIFALRLKFGIKIFFFENEFYKDKKDSSLNKTTGAVIKDIKSRGKFYKQSFSIIFGDFLFY